MRGFFEADPSSQVSQLIATNNQPTGLPIDVAEARLGRNDPVQPAGFYRRVDETSLTSW